MSKSPEDALKAVAKTSSKGRELAIRIVSALVLIAVVLVITMLPDHRPFLVMLSVGVALLCIEWGLMMAPNISGRISVAVALAAISALFVGFLGHPILSILVLTFGALCAGLYAYRLHVGWLDAAYGAMYIGWPAIVIMWLHQSNNGTLWVLFAFLIAWAADSAAFLVGRMVGGPKLWPRYSPNKTWSGFAGGLIAGMLTAGALSDLTGLFKHDISASMVGLLTALATMGGDLWESALKRRFGVKDAGTLIPGHGGLLDRVDGLMFAIVAIGGIRLLVLLGTEI
ncbi:phosphatidate cytidylyltransferase [Asticcacaulis sp. 201]|uniref:phosphatidate cytidylyltransferase n=1 Tax=Asticcacaulis sp. 201 TaxID=3028787 RepID=UPI00291636BF|nr:phosphatidate cytidylyltransferase [Asticcacaulis sp. 201]MDV6329312.1 phosphatidate cytidylyltransferase [Asticcacaulis sp. 201]